MKIFFIQKKLIILKYIIVVVFFIIIVEYRYIFYIFNSEYQSIEKYLQTCSSSKSFNFKKTNFSLIPKISIISPVYNTGKFVIKLLRSIQLQNFTNIEIILIDDCSIDNSLELIKEYQKEDNRIRIIKNKKNKGTLTSRIIGIFKSIGDYIIIPDSDDILLENSLKYFYNFAIKYGYEILRFNIYLGYGETFFGDITKDLKSRPIYQPELSTYLFYALGFLKQIDFNISNKFIKREALIRALNVFPKKDLNMYMSEWEDGLLNYILYRTCNSLYFLKAYGYYYITNKNLKKEYKKGYQYSHFKCMLTYIIYVYNFSKNTKYEKDMVNELFGGLFYKENIKDILEFIHKEPKFSFNIIDKLSENKFFLYKYKIFINNIKTYYMNKGN